MICIRALQVRTDSETCYSDFHASSAASPVTDSRPEEAR